MQDRRVEGGRREWVVQTAQIVVLAALYFCAGKLGLSLAFANPSASPVWPPTGLALAAMVVFGRRLWPAIMIGAFLTNVSTTGNLPTSIAIAFGNTLEAVIGGYLIDRHAGGKDAFLRPHFVFRFALYGVLVSTLISPTIGVSSLALDRLVSVEQFSQTWFTWWLGDLLGALAFAPVIMLWFPLRRQKMPVSQIVEGTIAIGVLVLCAYAVFGQLLPLELRTYARNYMCYPPLLWIAFRFHPRILALALLLLTAIAVPARLSTSVNLTPVQRDIELLLIQGFVGITSISAIALSAAVYGKRIALKKLEESEERFRTLADSTPALIWMTDHEALCTFVNKTWIDFTGCTFKSAKGIGWTDFVHPDDLEKLLETYLSAFEARKNFGIDFRIKRADGAYRWLLNNGIPRFLPDGEFAGYVGTCSDITERKQHEVQLQREAMLDPLCGLPNRILFMDRLGHRLLRRPRDSDSRFAVLFFDLDKFKEVNDNFGHQAGDWVLIGVAHRLSKDFRAEDTVARISGDEFAILVEDVEDYDEAARIAKRVLDVLSEPFRHGNSEITITASIGVVVSNESHETPEMILKDADAAMYRAKAHGRSQYALFAQSKAERETVKRIPNR